MVLIAIAFPISVTRACWTSRSNVDRDKVKIEVPQIDLPPLDFRDTEQ